MLCESSWTSHLTPFSLFCVLNLTCGLLPGTSVLLGFAHERKVQPVMVKYPHQEQCVYTGSVEYVVEIPHSKSILYYSLWCELNLRKYILSYTLHDATSILL